MIYGYARVSTKEQNVDRVHVSMKVINEDAANVKLINGESELSLAVTPTNLRDMQAVLETANRMNVHTQAANYLFPPVRLHPEMCGQNYRMEAEEAGKAQAQFEFLRYTKEQFLRRVRAFCSKVPPDDGEDDCNEDDGGSAAGDVMRCRAGKAAFWIDWDGKMLPCGQMAEPAVNVLELGFVEAWKQTRANAAGIRLPPECAVCDIKNVCRACAAMCYCETGRFDGKPDYVCRMHRSYLSAMKQYCREAYGEKII